MLAAIITVLVAILVLIAGAIICAFCVYAYPEMPLLLDLLSLVEVAWVGFTSMALLAMTGQLMSIIEYESPGAEKVTGHDIWVIAVVLGLSIILIYVYNEYIMFLVSVWQVDLGQMSDEILGFPGRVVRYAAGFFSEFSGALTGASSSAAPATPRPSPVAGQAPVLSVALTWVGSSIWNVVLGVVSGILTALLLRGRA